MDAAGRVYLCCQIRRFGFATARGRLPLLLAARWTAGSQGDPDDRLEVEPRSQSEHPDDIFTLIANRVDDHLDRW